ncbi:MAG: hypothetical protein IJL50_05570 [Bacteroidaceae bacterium]|nr:hypothetical protein [Bacteroidaceae bacterium]
MNMEAKVAAKLRQLSKSCKHFGKKLSTIGKIIVDKIWRFPPKPLARIELIRNFGGSY